MAFLGIVAFLLATYPLTEIITDLGVRKMFKDAADMGYIFKFNNMDSVRDAKKEEELRDITDVDKILNKDKNDERYIYEFLRKLPVFNVVDALARITTDKSVTVEVLRINGSLEPMTREEEEEYLKNRSYDTAITLASKRKCEEDELINKYKYGREVRELESKLDILEVYTIENDEEKKVDIDELIKQLKSEELKELRDNLLTIEKGKELIDDNREEEYKLTNSQQKTLIYRFMPKNNN